MKIAIQLSVLACAACAGDDIAGAPAGRVAIAVSPLALAGIGDAAYDVRVIAGAGSASEEVVWSEAGLLASRFGDGRGSISYVGPCDASRPPHRVELTLQTLWDEAGVALAADEWQSPGLVSRLVTCVENGDVPVRFDLTIMRRARQGFFDIAVSFEDVFCSAKLDCVDAGGGPLELLHRPGGARDRTVVLGFACTAGPNAPATWLHLSDVRLECGAERTAYRLDPSRDPGNAGAVAPVLYQTAIYRDDEELPGLDKCFWNLALGVDEGPAAADCWLFAEGSASAAPFDDGRTPARHDLPFLGWQVQLTGPTGLVTCGAHPLDGAGPAAGVSTRYTDFAGAAITHQWQCGGPRVVSDRLACDGQLAGGGDVTFTPTPGGVVAAFGNSLSPSYDLPAGLTLASCCGNPCCVSGAAP